MDTEELGQAAIAIGNQLCDEAIVADDQAVWSGAQLEMVDGDWQAVEATVGPDVYGGTAGIALFLARLGTTVGSQRHLDHARKGIQHSLTAMSANPALGSSLFAGSTGVAAAAVEIAALTNDDDLASTAHALTIAEPDAADLIAGSAGMVIAALAMHRASPDQAWLDRARSWGQDLLDRSETNDMATQRWWPSDIGVDEPPLLGLGHGASGCAWPLAELAVATGDHAWFGAVEEAVAYERTFLDHERGNWPDLRELGAEAIGQGKEPAWPAFWCHGAPGIGLTRLRFFEISGEPRYRDEATVAVVSSMRFAAEMSREPQLHDASLCHGVAGVIELLREAGRVLHDPSHQEAAHEVARVAIDMADGGRWPSGVRDGGENPSLMLGMAGIGGALLNLAIDEPRSLGLLWAGTERSARINVKAHDPALVPKIGRRLADEVVGLRLERASKSGRMLMVVPASVSVSNTLAHLGEDPELAWAELDSGDLAR